jgi:hydrogenase expression/formation protein HypD
VSAVMGESEYRPIAEKWRVPIVITGFEPVDLLAGVLEAVTQLESGRAEVVNRYGRTARTDGNPAARELLGEIFEVCDRAWRGVGPIARSGWKLRGELAAFDAERRFDVGGIETRESSLCISGAILTGVKKPRDCPAFGRECTPDTPLGATMVSSEGACAAYYACGRHLRLDGEKPVEKGAR